MGKIAIAIFVLGLVSVPTVASCLIDNINACTTSMDTGLDSSLKNRILPNRLEQHIQPNSSFNNRNNLGQPNLPDSINMEPAQEENTQPYNANCQFGNCLNRKNAGQNGNLP